MDIYDYLNWRGDLTFEQDELNEVDNIILSRISYFPFEKSMLKHLTLFELYNILKKNNFKDMDFEEDKKLLEFLSKSNRFKDLNICEIEKNYNITSEEQFFALTIFLPYNKLFVSYRGTDNSFVGWKEDFNLSFTSNIPSQIKAAQYLNYIENKYLLKKIIVGGHSKGGNLAIYAAMHSKNKKRIIKVYNNDGPGFLEEIINSNNYKKILSKITTYIPESSIIGRLLNHEEGYVVVKSLEKGIMQHDLYSWQVLGKNFVYSNDISKKSALIEKIIKNWLNQITMDEREKVINVFYQILISTNAKSFKELDLKWFSNARILFKSYQNINKKDKEMISKSLSTLFKSIKENVFSKTLS